MAEIYGKKLTKRDALSYAGNMRQLGGIRRSTLSTGAEDGVKVIDVSTGLIDFTAVESRALDVCELKYKGFHLNFTGKNGLVGAQFADPTNAPLRSVNGGMFYTAGLTNVGDAYEDGDYFHGRMRLIPASNVSATANWQDDEYIINISGDMYQNGVLHENLCLSRHITTKLGAKSFTVTDRVINEGFSSSPLMIMYHVVAGFPLLDDGMKIFMKTKEQAPEGAYSACAPNPEGSGNAGYFHEVLTDIDGNGMYIMWNPYQKLGLSVKFDGSAMPRLCHWKSMVSGDYAMGLMPTNCFSSGRKTEIDQGTLPTIEAGGAKDFYITFTVIDGEDELNSFLAELENYRY